MVPKISSSSWNMRLHLYGAIVPTRCSKCAVVFAKYTFGRLLLYIPDEDSLGVALHRHHDPRVCTYTIQHFLLRSRL